MIAAVKTKITDGVVGITGITKKPVNQSGKTETPSDRLTLDTYADVVGTQGVTQSGQEMEACVGCEIFVWKDGKASVPEAPVQAEKPEIELTMEEKIELPDGDDDEDPDLMAEMEREQRDIRREEEGTDGEESDMSEGAPRKPRRKKAYSESSEEEEAYNEDGESEHEDREDMKKHKKLRREFENCGLENKFEKAHELLEEHGIEGELEDFFEELYGGDSDTESGCGDADGAMRMMIAASVEYDSESDYGSDSDAEQKVEEKPKKEEKKAVRIISLRSEGKLVGRQVKLDMFGEQKKSSAQKKEAFDEDEEEEEEQPSTVQFCFDGAVTDESDTTAVLKGEWRAANPVEEELWFYRKVQ
eukprot:s959_g2.t1